MRVERISHIGIGYAVCANADNKDLEDDLLGYLQSSIGYGFSAFETNSGYDTEMLAVFLVSSEPFKYGLDLTTTKKELDIELLRLRLEKNSDFGAVGGIFTY